MIEQQVQFGSNDGATEVERLARKGTEELKYIFCSRTTESSYIRDQEPKENDGLTGALSLMIIAHNVYSFVKFIRIDLYSFLLLG